MVILNKKNVEFWIRILQKIVHVQSKEKRSYQKIKHYAFFFHHNCILLWRSFIVAINFPPVKKKRPNEYHGKNVSITKENPNIATGNGNVRCEGFLSKGVGRWEICITDQKSWIIGLVGKQYGLTSIFFNKFMISIFGNFEILLTRKK